MPVNLTVTVGTVNFTDWLHVTCAKVSAPGAVVDEIYIDVPITNYVFNFNNLDPENYVVSFYDSPDNVSLGTIQMQLIVNALTSEWQYEKRFYKCGGPNPADPANTSDNITDTYLIGKNVIGVFKEGFRFYIPTIEYSFDATTGKILDLTGSRFTTNEVCSVDIKHAVGTLSATVGGFYTGIIDVTEVTRTMLSSERNALLRLVCATAKQGITLPMLSSISIDDGFYFDNCCGGVAKCVKIFTNPADDIQYSGFNTSNILFKEFWVRQGEMLLLRKFDSKYWEVRLYYPGNRVGVKEMIGYKAHAGIQPENGALIDGDEEGRLYWFVDQVLPSTHKYTDATIATAGGVHTASKRGQFCLHPTLKRFRMPDTRGLMAKGLADFDTYGTDTANRPVDAPGGFQAEMLKAHGHRLNTGGDEGAANPGKSLNRRAYNGDGYAASGGNGLGTGTGGPYVEVVGGAQNRVDNFGVIWGVHL